MVSHQPIFLLGVLLILGCGGGGSPSSTPPAGSEMAAPPVIEEFSPPPTKPEVALTAPDEPIPVSQEFQVVLDVHEVHQLYGVALSVRYDPAQLTYIRHLEGDLLNQDGAPTVTEVAVAEDAPGEILVGVTRVGEVGGVSGSGTLATLVFEAREPGRATVQVAEATATLRDPNDTPLDVSDWPGVVLTIQ